MKKSLLLALTILLAVGNLSAQTTKKSGGDKGPKNFTFSQGKDIKERKLSVMSSVAGHDAGSIYMVGFRPKGVIIGLIPIVSMKYIFQSYNADDMSLEKVHRANAFRKQFKKNYFLASDMLNEEPYMFTYETVKKKSKESLAINYYSIDKGTMKPSAKSKLVEIPKSGFKKQSKIRYVFSFLKALQNNSETASRLNYLRSPDKKTFYIVSIAEDKNSKKSSKKSKSKKTITQNVAVYAFDTNMELLWEKQDKIKFEKAGSVITGIDADNLGTVYFTVKQYEEKRKGESLRNGNRNYTYQLYYVNKEADAVETVNLNLDNKFVTQMAVKVLDDSVGAVCAGFYYDSNTERKKDNVSGAFLGVVDKDKNEMLDESFYEFDPAVLDQEVKVRTVGFFGKKKSKEDKSGGTEDIVLRKVFVRPDGNIVVTGERYYMYVVTTTTGTGTSRTTRTEYHYIFNDILATCITPAGQTEWTVRIPKYQHQVNGTFLSSFVPSMNGNDLYFVYNDHSDNSKNTTTGTFTSADLMGKNNVISIVKVDKDGDVSKSKLSTKAEMGGMTTIGLAMNIENKKIIMPVMNKWGRLKKYGIIDFKKPTE